MLSSFKCIKRALKVLFTDTYLRKSTFFVAMLLFVCFSLSKDSLRTAETRCLQMESEMSEATKLNWIVAESDIQQILEAGLFPESVLQSAGMYRGLERVKLVSLLCAKNKAQYWNYTLSGVFASTTFSLIFRYS